MHWLLGAENKYSRDPTSFQFAVLVNIEELNEELNDCISVSHIQNQGPLRGPGARGTSCTRPRSVDQALSFYGLSAKFEYRFDKQNFWQGLKRQARRPALDFISRRVVEARLVFTLSAACLLRHETLLQKIAEI